MFDIYFQATRLVMVEVNLEDNLSFEKISHLQRETLDIPIVSTSFTSTNVKKLMEFFPR